MADLDPTRWHEQRVTRPVAVMSVTDFNEGPAGIVIVLPVTSRQRDIPTRVPISPPEGGLRVQSDILCDQVRAISSDRLVNRTGELTPATLTAIEVRLRALLGL
jgi:mRNA interferase MazF